jgi:hypothetical protein
MDKQLTEGSFKSTDSYLRYKKALNSYPNITDVLENAETYSVSSGILICENPVALDIALELSIQMGSFIGTCGYDTKLSLSENIFREKIKHTVSDRTKTNVTFSSFVESLDGLCAAQTAFALSYAIDKIKKNLDLAVLYTDFTFNSSSEKQFAVFNDYHFFTYDPSEKKFIDVRAGTKSASSNNTSVISGKQKIFAAYLVHAIPGFEIQNEDKLALITLAEKYIEDEKILKERKKAILNLI